MPARIRRAIEIFSPVCPQCRSPRVQLGYGNTTLSQRLVGINELLCNNCGLTFNGFAVPGTVKRAPSERKERSNNKQQAPRFKAQFPVALSVMGTDSWSSEQTFSPKLEGQTRDISKNGLAVAVPDHRYQGYDFGDSSRRLLVTVALPNGTVELRAAPVRLQQIVPQTLTAGWLLGLRVVKMSERDLSYWNQYLNTLIEKHFRSRHSTA